jgi:hypothetical protein
MGPTVRIGIDFPMASPKYFL